MVVWALLVNLLVIMVIMVVIPTGSETAYGKDIPCGLQALLAASLGPDERLVIIRHNIHIHHSWVTFTGHGKIDALVDRIRAGNGPKGVQKRGVD